jgi:hypothetical protein
MFQVFKRKKNNTPSTFSIWIYFIRHGAQVCFIKILPPLLEEERGIKRVRLPYEIRVPEKSLIF